MKSIRWKALIITSIVCLLPILFGMAMWDKLPDAIAIHFDINNNPDNFAGKGFAVFGLPCMMVILQWICCITADINIKKHGRRIKLDEVTRWIIPVMCVILYFVTLGYSLGWELDIRRVAVGIVGVMLLVTGNYLPKLDYVKNYNLTTEQARKINRFLGFETAIMGVLFIGSIFLPPVASIVCLCLLVPYIIIGVLYGIKVGRSEK
ncbi:MAG: DUF1648 domain-containing protein [Clostridia bacterium]|nr:DUF1648 domain-containing protein [Clostridia bacterium]